MGGVFSRPDVLKPSVGVVSVVHDNNTPCSIMGLPQTENGLLSGRV